MATSKFMKKKKITKLPKLNMRNNEKIILRRNDNYKKPYTVSVGHIIVK